MGKKHKVSVWELGKWADKAQSFNRTIETTCKSKIQKNRDGRKEWCKPPQSEKGLETVTSHHPVLPLCTSIP